MRYVADLLFAFSVFFAFAGVVGRIKRVGGNRCVVLPIGNEMAVGILDIPRAFLRYLTPDDALLPPTP